MSINGHTYGDLYPAVGTGEASARSTTPSSGTDGGQDSSQAAARLLEKTAREAEQWRAEAKNEAAAIVAGAREEAARLVRTAREEAEGLVTSARDEAAQTVDSARAEAYRVREETAAVRKRHDEDVAHLQQVATQHRERLRQHLTVMLDEVNATAGEGHQ